MDTCGHCHNVLPRTVDRCTVCGTERVDPAAADVRRREDGDLPSHAPGWAAPPVQDPGIHPDDFLRELTGEQTPPAEPAGVPPRALAPRPIPATPAPGALAGYLGTSIDRTAKDEPPPPPNIPSAPQQSSAPSAFSAPSEDSNADRFGQHLSTATNVAPDGVAARTTRLDGTVKLGPTPSHRLLTIGAPLVAGLLLVGGVLGSYNIRSSEAEEIEAAAVELGIEATAAPVHDAAVVRLDLDGCGMLDQTTGFLFADRTILVPRSEVITDHRPMVRMSDGTSSSSQILGWSLIRNLAVVRSDDRLTGGLEWGVSSRVATGDVVTVLAISGPGVADPIPATVVETNTLNGVNVSFELDVSASEGSLVLSAAGFVIGVVDGQNLTQASDDIAPTISRVVLADERPQAVCPTPPSTAPPSTVENEADRTQPGVTQPDE